MSMSTMTTDGELMVPNGWTGKIDSSMSTESKRPLENRIITNALQKIDRDIEQLFQLRSSLSQYGLSKICPTELTTVTEDNGLVLGAKEKNPAIEGTLANISKKIVQNKVINIYKASIDVQSINGLYYKYFKSVFLEEGIEESKVLSVTLNDFVGASEMFGVGVGEYGILIMSNSPQTIDKVVLNVTYLNI